MQTEEFEIHPEAAAMKEELEQFRKEKEQIRALVGQIGGAAAHKHDKVINVVFIALLVTLFVLDVLRHVLHIDTPLPPLFSLELGVLMVSVKIIWMMHKQAKVEHFQFWMLSSIEFRLNDVAKHIKALEKNHRDVKEQVCKPVVTEPVS